MTSQNLLLGILIVVVFAVGFLVGRFSSLGDTYISDKGAVPVRTTNQPVTGTSTTPDTSNIVSRMTDEQKKMLGALGIDTTKITSAMITCAETSLGASRVEEIKNGASLSFMEKAKLVACYK